MTWNQPESQKTCPRCGAAFECRVDDLARCDCVAVEVSLPLLERLKDQYPDCLCSPCLRALARADPTTAG